MGNIYIVGVPRSGKTTLAKMICEVRPDLNQISFEAVRNGFSKAQPGLGMGDRNSEARKQILPEFIFEFLHWNEEMTGKSAVMEGSFAKVEDVVRHIREDDVVICLGFGGRDLETVAEQVLLHAEKGDYIFGCAKEEFLRHFYDLETTDCENLNYCRENNVAYYDTFGDRGKILRAAADEVIKLE